MGRTGEVSKARQDQIEALWQQQKQLHARVHTEVQTPDSQGYDIHLVLTNIHVYIHQKCIYTYIHVHIHQDLVLWQLQPLQT